LREAKLSRWNISSQVAYKPKFVDLLDGGHPRYASLAPVRWGSVQHINDGLLNASIMVCFIVAKWDAQDLVFSAGQV
jgi:hypothetical protein